MSYVGKLMYVVVLVTDADPFVHGLVLPGHLLLRKYKRGMQRSEQWCLLRPHLGHMP